MMLPEFTIDLGNGVHLDSTGALTTGPVGGKASFSLAAPLPIPSVALQQAFSGLKTVIPKLDDIAKDLGLLDKFKSFGLSEDVISTFSKVAQIAETLASVIPIVNIVAGLLSVLGSFGGSDPIHDLITQEFTRLFARLDEIRRNELTNYTAGKTGLFQEAVNLIDDYHTEISKKYFIPGEREQKLHDLDIKASEVAAALNEVLGQTWTVPFDPVAYGNNWPYLNDRLFTVPTPGTLLPAVIPGGIRTVRPSADGSACGLRRSDLPHDDQGDFARTSYNWAISYFVEGQGRQSVPATGQNAFADPGPHRLQNGSAGIQAGAAAILYPVCWCDGSSYRHG
jgi:hypothetical protein